MRSAWMLRTAQDDEGIDMIEVLTRIGIAGLLLIGAPTLAADTGAPVAADVGDGGIVDTYICDNCVLVIPDDDASWAEPDAGPADAGPGRIRRPARDTGPGGSGEDPDGAGCSGGVATGMWSLLLLAGVRRRSRR
jgi:hypothetical protein